MGSPRSGREDGKLGDQKKVRLEGHKVGIGTGVLSTRAAVAAVESDQCSDMQREIKGWEQLLRSLKEMNQSEYWTMVTWGRAGSGKKKGEDSW